MRLSPLVVENSATPKPAAPHGAAAAAACERFHFYGYTVDRSTWVVRWQETQIVLCPKSFDLLLYLMDHRDRVVGKDELLKELWPRQIVEESNLSQHVFLLRKALSRHASGAKLIETIVGRGYRFVAELESALVPSDLSTFPQPEPATVRYDRPVSTVGRLSSRVTLAAAMFALGVSTGHYWQVRNPGQPLGLGASRTEQMSPALAGMGPQERQLATSELNH